jgi:hypothetical protein
MPGVAVEIAYGVGGRTMVGLGIVGLGMVGGLSWRWGEVRVGG